MSMTEQKAAELRKPFPASAIGKLPKANVTLDYVGHAATTDRLLQVDPLWNWEPFAVDERGLPALDSRGNLWIRLTVCGVTRVGVGDGKSAKEVIGDAIRNAAMRFGVALDLWSKEELEQVSTGADKLRAALATPAPAALPQSPADVDPAPAEEFTPDAITARQLTALNAAVSDLGLTREQKLAGVSATIGREIESTKDLTKDEATKVIKSLNASIAERVPA